MPLRKYKTDEERKRAHYLQNLAWNSKNPEKAKLIRDNYRNKNIEKITANLKKHYQDNKAEISMQQKIYYAANWEKVKAGMISWRLRNPEKWQENVARNYARKQLKDREYKASHPELYHLVKGKYRKNKPLKTQDKKLYNRLYESKQWEKNKNDPAYREAHRIRSRDYARRHAMDRKIKRQLKKLAQQKNPIYDLISILNHIRIEREKLKLLRSGDINN